jgi:PAS domain S-box-containing protein
MNGHQASKRNPEGGRLFQSLFDSAAIGIAVENMEGRPLFANPALCSMLGFSEEEFRAKHCVDFSPPEDAEKDQALFQQLRGGSIDKYQLDKRFYRKDGTLIWGRLSISLMLMDDSDRSSQMVIAMVEDITDKKVAEEKLQNLASRLIQVQEEERQRIGRELHDDIVQRITLLTLELEGLRDSLSEAGQGSQSQLASELRQKADALTTDIQNLSRNLHSARLDVLGLHFALRNLCEKISTQQHIPVTLRDEELTANLPPDMELCVFRVTQEALNNAVKHSRTPEVFVDLTYAGDAIVLKIRDFGIGFDPSIPHEGIGLSTMRERLRMFSGELSVQSVPGKGTTVIAKMKLEKAKSAATA